MLIITTVNNDFPAIECYTSLSNGIHLITVFSACCLASGIPDCWAFSFYLASRSPVNLKIREPEEHFNGCWIEHLFRHQLNFLPLRNFPGALHATHKVLLHCCLLSLLHAGSSHQRLHHVTDSKWSREGSFESLRRPYLNLIAFRVFVQFYTIHGALSVQAVLRNVHINSFLVYSLMFFWDCQVNCLYWCYADCFI